MMLYCLFLLFIFLFSILTEDKILRGNISLIFTFICFVFLITLITNRGDIGFDTEIYKAYFYSSTDNFKGLIYNYTHSRHEPGYLTIQFINRKIINHHVFHFFVIGLLSMIFIFLSVRKYTTYIYIALGLYFLRFFFLRDLNQIRAGLALAIVLYNIENINDKNVRKFYFYTILAALFHKTALLLIPFYYLNTFLTNRGSVKLITILFLSFCFSFINVKNFLNEIIVKYIPSASSYTQGYLSESGNVFSIIVLYQVVLFMIFVLSEKYLKNKQIHYFTIRNMLFCSLFLLFVFNDFGILSARLSTVFATVEILILPSFICLFKEKWAIKLWCFTFFVLLFYVNVYKRLGDEYFINF